MPLPIEDYALIGDCHTAALVGRDGSIDWLCLPRFDSGACFAAPARASRSTAAGCSRRQPAASQVRRRYRDGTLILETEFETDEGAVRVIDCMPLSNERWRRAAHRRRPARPRGDADGAGHPLRLRLDRALGARDRRRAAGHRRARHAGAAHRVPIARREPEDRGRRSTVDGRRARAVRAELPAVARADAAARSTPEQALQDTQAQWQAWSARCTYQGQWRDAWCSAR